MAIFLTTDAAWGVTFTTFPSLTRLTPLLGDGVLNNSGRPEKLSSDKAAGRVGERLGESRPAGVFALGVAFFWAGLALGVPALGVAFGVAALGVAFGVAALGVAFGVAALGVAFGVAALGVAFGVAFGVAALGVTALGDALGVAVLGVVFGVAVLGVALGVAHLGGSCLRSDYFRRCLRCSCLGDALGVAFGVVPLGVTAFGDALGEAFGVAALGVSALGDAFGEALGVTAFGDALGVDFGDTAFGEAFGVAVLGDLLGVVAFGDALALGVVLGLALGVAAFGDAAFLGVAFFGLGSSLIAGWEATAAMDARFLMTGFLPLPIKAPRDLLEGDWPRLTGVSGGRRLSNRSGLKAGPKDTRFLLALGATSEAELFRFCPETGVFFAEDLPSKKMKVKQLYN